jgi:ABC-type antimicrobial peptide transport system permease subunit
MDVLKAYQAFIVMIILVVATLSVSNTFIKIVNEREREIGTWRSLGFTHAQLMNLFATEALALGGVGILMGIIFSLFLTGIINSGAIYYRAGQFTEPIPFSIGIFPKSYLASGCILLVVCILSSTWSLRRILRKRICENLFSV